MFGSLHLLNHDFECSEPPQVTINEVDVYFEGSYYREGKELEKLLSIIARAYVNPRTLERLDGQFALVIHDRKKRLFLLLRDQFGIVPVYYASNQERVFFGTTMLPILQHFLNRSSPNTAVLHEYFKYGYAAGKATFFDSVSELGPGELLEVDERGRTSLRPYYRLAYQGNGMHDRSDADFEDLFINSLHFRTSDEKGRRTAVFSSGGIDSSILVSRASRILPPPVSTYYIGCEGYTNNRYGEVEFLSKACSTRQKNIVIDGRLFADHLMDTIRLNEEPLNHPSSVLRYYLCRRIRDEVDTVLSGQGADCLFCGYHTFGLIRLSRLLDPTRSFWIHALELLLRLPLSPALPAKIEKIRELLRLPPAEYALSNGDLAVLSDGAVEEILNQAPPQGFDEAYRGLLRGVSGAALLDILLKIYQTHFLVESLNTMTKLGNAAGIEHRHPFIQVDLVDFFNRLPWKKKSSFFSRKPMVMDVGRNCLPKEILRKRKEGFGVPLSEWLRDEKGFGRFKQVLRDKRTRERGLVNPRVLDDLLEGERRGDLTASTVERKFWPLINLELWFRMMIENKAEGYS